MDIFALLDDERCLTCVVEQLSRSDSAVDVRLADILARARSNPGVDHPEVLRLVSENWDLRITGAIATCIQTRDVCRL